MLKLEAVVSLEELNLLCRDGSCCFLKPKEVLLVSDMKP
jgi:hypothetical protein